MAKCKVSIEFVNGTRITNAILNNVTAESIKDSMAANTQDFMILPTDNKKQTLLINVHNIAYMSIIEKE